MDLYLKAVPEFGDLNLDYDFMMNNIRFYLLQLTKRMNCLCSKF